MLIEYFAISFPTYNKQKKVYLKGTLFFYELLKMFTTFDIQRYILLYFQNK